MQPSAGSHCRGILRWNNKPKSLGMTLCVRVSDKALLAGGKTSNMGQLSMVVFVMVMSGMCAGLLGIGGALVFNPFLLQMGVHPQVCLAILEHKNIK